MWILVWILGERDCDKITSKFTPPVGTSSLDYSWIREQVYVFRMDG